MQESDETAQLLEKIINELKSLNSTMKLFMLANRKQLSEMLITTLSSSSKIAAYHLTDGQHSAHNIAEATGVSITSIHRWWVEWERMGLISRVERNGKSVMIKNIGLEEAGIIVPDIDAMRLNENNSNEIPDEGKLISILRDSRMFHTAIDIVDFSERIFNTKIMGSSYDDIIKSVVNLFYKSPRMKQMMFLQALRQQATSTGSSFKEYFEFWEKRIKSEL